MTGAPTRPDPPLPSDDLIAVAVPVRDNDRWRVAPDGVRCSRRMRAERGGPTRCTAAAVLQLNRQYRDRDGSRRDAWWSYCQDHAYGRWVENGHVMRYVLRPRTPE